MVAAPARAATTLTPPARPAPGASSTTNSIQPVRRSASRLALAPIAQSKMQYCASSPRAISIWSAPITPAYYYLQWPTNRVEFHGFDYRPSSVYQRFTGKPSLSGWEQERHQTIRCAAIDVDC